MTEVIRTSGKAIASLVFGLLSLVCACFAGIPALILGLLALSDISKYPQQLKGRGLALTGVILGAIGSSLATVGILVALLLPAVNGARIAARKAQTSNNLKYIGVALQNYHDAQGSFPPAVYLDSAGQPGTSWRVALLPYLEAMDKYQAYHHHEPWNSPANQQAINQAPPVFRSPLSSLGNDVSYVAVTDPAFIFNGTDACRFSQITDGLSNTIIAVDAGRTGVMFAEPRDLTWQEFLQRFQNQAVGDAPGGFTALFADGAVAFIPYSTDPSTLQALFTKAGGEPVSPRDLMRP